MRKCPKDDLLFGDSLLQGENDRLATCTICKAKVSRGGQSVKSFTTSNLVGHLRKHSAEYKIYEDDRAAATVHQPVKQFTSGTSSKQLTFEESQSRSKVWDINDPRALCVTTKIGEMIAVDCHPYSIVDDPGFVSLMKCVEPRYTIPSRRYFTDNVLPKIHARILSGIKDELAGAKFFSFTSDIWSTEVSHDSLISLTAHWLTDSFKKKAAMLNASSFQGSHTADAIRMKCDKMLENWEIPKNQVHCFVVDNAANMKKAMTDGGFTYMGCFAHTLQLVVHDGIISQRYVQDILAKCRRIVGHFKHSQLAFSRLKNIQTTFGIPNHRLKQDVVTRWNSTLYMLESIIEQKMALAAYNTEHDDIPQLSAHQLDIIDKVITVLKPVEDVTQSISSAEASISIVIPFVKALRRSLEDHSSDDSGVQTMKKEMLSSLNRRFCDIENTETLALATLLDPCFKDKFFSGIVAREEAKSVLIDKVDEIINTMALEQPPIEEPQEKRPRTSVMKYFNEILEEAGTNSSSSPSSTAIVDQYLAEPIVDYRKGNAYTWWENNRSRFAILSQLALRYLTPPPTSVPSERLFSVAGDIYDEKRNRLSPEKAEILLFIKNNFHLI